MRVLILTQFFYPEMGAPASRFLDFARHFTERGHEVMVLTGFPNFPSGRIHEGYRGETFRVEKFENFTIYRTWLFTRPSPNFAIKSLGYASFGFGDSSSSNQTSGV